MEKERDYNEMKNSNFKQRRRKTKCYYCDRASYCNKGNMASAYQKFGNFEAPDPQCKYTPPNFSKEGK